MYLADEKVLGRVADVLGAAVANPFHCGLYSKTNRMVLTKA